MEEDEGLAMKSSLDDVYATLAEIREHLFAAQEAVWHEDMVVGVENSRQAITGALRACHKHKIGLQALAAQFPDALLPSSKAERSAVTVGGDGRSLPAEDPTPRGAHSQATPTSTPRQGETRQQQGQGRLGGRGGPTVDKSRDDLGKAASALEQSIISIDDVVRRGTTRPAAQSPPPPPHQGHQQQHAGVGPALYASGGGGGGGSSGGVLSTSQSSSGARAAEAAGGGIDSVGLSRWGATTFEGQQQRQQGAHPANVTPHAVMDREIVSSQQDWQPAPNSARGTGQVSYSSLKSQEEYDYAAAIRNKINSLGPMAPLALPDRSPASAPNSARRSGGGSSHSMNQEPIHLALEHVLSEYQARRGGGGGGQQGGGEGEEVVGGLMLVQHEIRPGILTNAHLQDQQAHHQHNHHQEQQQQQHTLNGHPSLRYSFNGETSIVPVQQGYSYPHMGAGGGGRRPSSNAESSTGLGPGLSGPHHPLTYVQGTSGTRMSSSSVESYGHSPISNRQGGGGYAGQQVEAFNKGSVVHQGVQQQQQQQQLHHLQHARPQQFQPFHGQDAFSQGQVMRMGRSNPQQYQVANAFLM